MHAPQGTFLNGSGCVWQDDALKLENQRMKKLPDVVRSIVEDARLVLRFLGTRELSLAQVARLRLEWGRAREGVCPRLPRPSRQ